MIIWIIFKPPLIYQARSDQANYFYKFSDPIININEPFGPRTGSDLIYILHVQVRLNHRPGYPVHARVYFKLSVFHREFTSKWNNRVGTPYHAYFASHGDVSCHIIPDGWLALILVTQCVWQPPQPSLYSSSVTIVVLRYERPLNMKCMILSKKKHEMYDFTQKKINMKCMILPKKKNIKCTTT